jgi:2-phosphosulfolactate phosphatase
LKLYCFHLPGHCPENQLPDCAVVIDVLRATTTVAAALAAGAEAVQAFGDLGELDAVSARWPTEKRLRAGERGGRRIAGYDLGNSPLDCVPERVRGRRLFFSTTNGTQALRRVRSAPMVLTSALVNRHRVLGYLLERQPPAVWLIASGWEGHFSLEDTLCAGAIGHGVLAESGGAMLALAGNDEMVAAIALYRQWRNRLLDGLSLASHGQRLLRLGFSADLEFCSQRDTLDILPVQNEPGVLVSFPN